MRQGTLFARLRGHDGRSLARALVLLILVSLFAGGLNAGAAVASGDVSLCLVDDAGGNALPQPGHDHRADCCILGPTPFGTALISVPPPAIAPAPAIAALTWPEAVGATTGALTIPATARGPPLAA